MDRIKELHRLLNKEEYEQQEQNQKSLQESAAEFHRGINEKFYNKQAPLRRMKAKCNYTKEVICECMCNLYESALVIDDVDKYSNSLREAMKDEVMQIMESANKFEDLCVMFENASPYIKGILVLCEETFESKDDDEIKTYDDKILLSKDDLNLINKFEKEEGKDVYADELQNRIIDVYKAEEQMGEDQKEKVQAVVDELAKIKSDKENRLTESIEHGINLFSTTPKTLFNAIFINKSKSFMNETASADLNNNAEKVLAETIATYTLLETIHALGVKTYSPEEIRKMKMDFFIS